MDNLEIKVPETADAAEAEKDKAAAVAGKFKSVKALEEAYLSLQAEFTRRSQRLKELEASIAKALPEDAEAQTQNATQTQDATQTQNSDTQAEQKCPASLTVSPEKLLEAAMADESLKNAIISNREIKNAIIEDEGVKNEIIAQYLKTVSNKKSIPLIFGGVQVAAQKQTPKSVKEAGQLASQFLSGK